MVIPFLGVRKQTTKFIKNHYAILVQASQKSSNINYITILTEMERELAENLMFHINELSKHCRICGGRLQKAKSKTTAPTHPCDSSSRDCLLSTFSVDIDTDDPHIHPARFCNRCWAATRKHRIAVEDGKEYHCSISPFLWEEHSSQCKVNYRHVIISDTTM